MTTYLKTLRARFRRDQDGSASIEFVLYFSVMFMVLAAGIEISYMNLKHAMLERSVDLVVRDIRINTGNVPTYEEVRTDICERATVLDECNGNLRLEMIEVDPRAFSGLPNQADCQNAQEEPRPVRSFEPGEDNKLMLLRACLKFKPVFPTTALGAEFNLDDEGYAQLLVTSSFVQEPN